MRIGVAALAMIPGIAGPMLMGRRLLRDGTPRQIVGYALVSLGALVAASMILLGTLVDASSLPFRDLPSLVNRCVDAAGRLLAHPLRHWPRIGAAVLLLGLLARLLWAVLAIVHDARRELHGLASLESHAGGGDRPGLLIVRSDRPFALAAGILRRRVVVSDSLLRLVDADERRAVIAHERAHLRGWHPLLSLLGRSVVRAFPFLPPAREAADQLLIGLEMSADEAAVRTVGDRLVVARAIVRLAERANTPAVGSGMAAAGAELRVERLLRTQRPHSVGACFRAASAVGTVLGLVCLLVIAAPAGVLRSGSRSEAPHAACQLPRGAQASAKTPYTTTRSRVAGVLR